MEGMISFGNKRTYEDFKKQIPLNVVELFDSMREFCLSLGKNVTEDVRMHRIVFGKSLSFRWFVDLEPQTDQIVIKIQKDRKIPTEIVFVKNSEDFNKVKHIIQNAYETIR